MVTVTDCPSFAPTKKLASKLPFNILSPANSVYFAIRETSAFNAVISEDIAALSSVLKKSHGSALFTRGETQSLASVTLGSAEDEQRADSILLKDFSKSFYLHYMIRLFLCTKMKLTSMV